jgi:hypothetical protein
MQRQIDQKANMAEFDWLRENKCNRTDFNVLSQSMGVV